MQDNIATKGNGQGDGAMCDSVRTEPFVDPSLGRAALARLDSMLAALSPDELHQVNAGLGVSASRALKLAGFVRRPEVRARLELLSGNVFDSRQIERLNDAAWAAWHVYNENLVADVQATQARLPAPMVTSAKALRSRMLKVAEYHLGGEDEVAKELGSIRRRGNYLDVASDLTRLGLLYDERRADLELDARWYDAGDADEARKLASEMVRLLDASCVDPQTDQARRVWTLLRRTYDDVRDACRFVLRHDASLRGQIRPLLAKRRGLRAATAASAETDAAETGTGPPDANRGDAESSETPVAPAASETPDTAADPG